VIDASQRAQRLSYGELEGLVAEQAALIETLRARIAEQDRRSASCRRGSGRTRATRPSRRPRMGTPSRRPRIGRCAESRGASRAASKVIRVIIWSAGRIRI
jgi:hypothetical protein